MSTKGICLILSMGRLFSPSLSCRGQGIGKQRGTISLQLAYASRGPKSRGASSWHNAPANRPEVPLSAVFFSFFFFSHFDIIRLASRPKTSKGKKRFIHVLVKLSTGIATGPVARFSKVPVTHRAR